MKKSLLLILLVILNKNIWAEEWVKIASREYTRGVEEVLVIPWVSEVYVDVDSITKASQTSEHIKTFKLKFINKMQGAEFNEDELDQRIEYNCLNNYFRTIYQIEYDYNFNTNKKEVSKIDSNATNWEKFVIDETDSADMFINALCMNIKNN